ncbi:MAG: TetR/AcrR family transcriptional regulator [Anaerolineaceae bacterium]
MQSRSQLTREKILSTSYQLFLEQGYQSTGIAQICEKANLSKGAFYHHFPSKHDLFLALLENWLQEIDSVFGKIQVEIPSPVQQLRLMSKELDSIFTAADQFPMFIEVWMQSMRDPTISEKIIAPYYKYLSFFEKIFDHGINDGSISSDSEPRSSSRLIMAFVMGMILQCTIEPSGEDWQKLSHFGINKILLGLQKELQ